MGLINCELEKMCTCGNKVNYTEETTYHPQANKREEVAVKQVEQIVEGNLGPKGELDMDRLARALLEERNTAYPQTGLSPAMVVFVRRFLLDDKQLNVRREWRINTEARE